jgi:hypothetical protein
MKRFALVVPTALVALGFAACTDKVEKSAPTAPTAAPSASVAEAAPERLGLERLHGVPVVRDQARRRRSPPQALGEVLEESGSAAAEKLVEKSEAEVEKLNAILADACN